MEQYTDRALSYTKQLENHVVNAASKNAPVNVRDLFYWFAFDVMGDFALGRDFGMLENEHWHESIVILKRAMRLLGPIGPVVWLARWAFKIIPGIWPAKDWFRMIHFCEDRIDERLKVNTQFRICSESK